MFTLFFFCFFFFFFQAEDGIRDLYVTGVQTCALPISAARLESREQGCRMTAIAERAVYGEFAWLRIKDLHDFANHHRPVHAGRRLTALDHLIDVGGIALRVVLFIFFGKMARILPFVPWSAFGFFRSHSGQPVEDTLAGSETGTD